MSLRTLTQNGETILSTEDEVVSALTSPIQVCLPIIGDGTGNTVLPGWTVSITTQAAGEVSVLDHLRREVTRVKGRSSKLLCAVAAPDYGWSSADHPLTYPGSRVTGGLLPAPHTHPISDIVNLQTTLDGKAALVHTHTIADTPGLQAVLDGKALAVHTHDAADIITGTLLAARLPVATVATKGASKVDNLSAGDPIALTSAGHGAAADPHPQYALDTEKGAASGIATLDGAGKLTASQLPLGTSASTAAAGNDSRLSDARTPTAHHPSHEPGGTDPMAVDAAAATGSLRTLGTGAAQAAAGNHTHAAADVTSGRFVAARMLDGTAGLVITGNGSGSDPSYKSLVTVRLTADNAAIAAAAPTTALQVANLTQAALVNEEWDIEWILEIANSVAADVFVFNVTSTAGTLTGRYVVEGANGVPASGAAVAKRLMNPAGTITTATANAPGATGTIGLVTTVTIRARVKLTVSNGTIQLLLRAGTNAAASSGTATVKAQSQMIATKIV